MKESLGMVVTGVNVQEAWDFIAIWIKKAEICFSNVKRPEIKAS